MSGTPSFHAGRRYKYLMQFMCDNAPEVAEEIRTVYIESMGRTIAALFRAYHAQLMKLELSTAGRHDVIAVEVSKFLKRSGGPCGNAPTRRETSRKCSVFVQSYFASQLSSVLPEIRDALAARVLRHLCIY